MIDETLRKTVLATPAPLVLVDLDLAPLVFSAGWNSLTLGAFDRASFMAFLGEKLAVELPQCAADGARRSGRCEIQSASGPRSFAVDANAWPGAGEPAQFILVSVRDTTEAADARRQMAKARAGLAEQNLRLEATFGNVPHGIGLFDADRRVILANGAYARLYALPLELIKPGTALADILDYRARTGTGPTHLGNYFDAEHQAKQTGETAGHEVLLNDGRTIRVTHSPIQGGGYVATHEDVSESLRATARIKFLAYRDALTELENRASFQRAFDAAVADAQRRQERFGLVMIDVDHFKFVNDSFGHDAGDALLKALAVHLQATFRRGDTVARLGGDEFAIVLRDLRDERDVSRPIECLQLALRDPVEHAGHRLNISTSIGAAVFSGTGEPADILKNADVALYQAKAAGRNRSVIFRPEMRIEVERHAELLRTVRAALLDGQFDLHYQPVVDIATRQVDGFEALMRWHHPEKGVLTPDAFIAAFKDKDLAQQLGEFTLRRALEQMRHWTDQHIDFGYVAINVSRSQFRSGRLAADIEAQLAHWQIPAHKLAVEVSENVYMDPDARAVNDTIGRLHDAGVLVALDDVGTVFASLAKRRRLPIDCLKIDKSFVQNEANQDIVRAVINLGASMKMKVIAEGVEDPRQLASLTQFGCDQIQGFLVARPMGGPEVADFIKAFRRRGLAPSAVSP